MKRQSRKGLGDLHRNRKQMLQLLCAVVSVKNVWELVNSSRVSLVYSIEYECIYLNMTFVMPVCHNLSITSVTLLFFIIVRISHRIIY